MAQHIQVIDDLDGTPNARTVTFQVEGKAYSVDLAEHNIERLLEALRPFVEVAVSSRPSGVKRDSLAADFRKRRTQERTVDPREVREWAAAQGIEVGDRGRVPGPTVQAFLEATGGSVTPIAAATKKATKKK